MFMPGLNKRNIVEMVSILIYLHLMTDLGNPFKIQNKKTIRFFTNNSLKLSFRNISGFHSNFVKCVNLSFNQTPPDFLFLCKINLDDSINSGSFCEGLSSFNLKDSVTHMHGFAVYMKKDLPFCMILISRKLPCVFDWLYFTQCFTSFSSMDHLLHLHAQLLIPFHLI